MFSLNIPLIPYKTYLWKLSYLSFYTIHTVEIIFLMYQIIWRFYFFKRNFTCTLKENKSAVLGKLLRTVLYLLVLCGENWLLIMKQQLFACSKNGISFF